MRDGHLLLKLGPGVIGFWPAATRPDLGRVLCWCILGVEKETRATNGCEWWFVHGKGVSGCRSIGLRWSGASHKTSFICTAVWYLRTGTVLEETNADRALSLNQTAHEAKAMLFLISAMALAGLSPFGHVLEQFKIVWHRYKLMLFSNASFRSAVRWSRESASQRYD